MNNLSWNISDNSDLSYSLFYSQNSMEFRDDDVYGRMLLSSLDYDHIYRNNTLIAGRLKYSHWAAM
ncbi:MAG: hypothetical protein RQ743_12490 [Bacteroidales bacterium]|nr:hypothetical protein [Bacteroidales bacterium]